MKNTLSLAVVLASVQLALACGGTSASSGRDGAGARADAADAAGAPGAGGIVTGTGGRATGGGPGRGGATAAGGVVAGGGSPASGGTTGIGGSAGTHGGGKDGGTDAPTATGGAAGIGTGGATATGGRSATGGITGTGGRTAIDGGSDASPGRDGGTGGALPTGGSGAGGITTTGGSAATGGAPGTGGTPGTGGMPGTGGTGTTSFTWDFPSDTQGWIGAFADYPPNIGTGYDLAYGWASLPPEVGPGGGLRFSSNNHSDDIFMFVKRAITGLSPSTLYALDVVAVIDTNAPADCGGIGGAPGLSVAVKIGASTFEPSASLDSQGYLRLNIDKGNQSVGGADMKVVGDLGNTKTCPDETYEPKTFTLSDFRVASGADGTVWLILGTDSGFEGITTLYYDRITLSLRAVP